MRSIWQSLAWKEWHEHKWKLAAILAVPWGATFFMMLVDGDRQEHVFLVSQICIYFCIVPFAVFIGMGAAAGERSRGTLPFLQALPVPMWRVALNKIAFGLITLFVPLLLSLLLILIGCKVFDLLGISYESAIRMLEAEYRPLITSQNIFLDMTFVGSLGAAGLFFWSAAPGVNQKDELRAGAVALLAMIAWWMLLVFWAFLLSRSNAIETARIRAMGLGTAPGSAFMLGRAGDGYTRGVAIMAAIVTYALLARRYIRRFGLIAKSENYSSQGAIRDANRAEWLPPPRRSRLTAIAWKQVRESAPILIAGLAGTIGVFLIFIAVSWREINYRPNELFDVFSGIAVLLGFVVAIVLGIGVCLYDMSPPLSAFWRSRPINPDVWFWTKFLAGLTILLVAIYLPIVLFALALQSTTSLLAIQADAYTFPLAHMAIFASAVMVTCLVRQAVYSAILSITATYLGIFAGVGLWWTASYLGLVSWDSQSWRDLNESRLAFGLVVSFCISTLFAWLAMRYDWGRKSGY